MDDRLLKMKYSIMYSVICFKLNQTINSTIYNWGTFIWKILVWYRSTEYKLVTDDSVSRLILRPK